MKSAMPRDLEDLAVVLGQAAGLELRPVTASLREQPDDQRDAGRVDVSDAG